MSRRLPSLLVVWLSLAASLSGEELFPDLAEVRGIDRYRGSEAGKGLLRKNGFVVVPRFYRRIFNPYLDSGLRNFVTADSVHRTFHVIFEEQLKRVETAFAREVASLTSDLLGHLPEMRKSAGPGAGDAGALLEAYFAVAAMLLGEELDVHPPQKRLAEQEARMIRAAAGPSPSPVFGYPIDYSQFKPRGFYTETAVLRRHFKVMNWYGSAAFRLKSERETRAAMRIAGAFARDKRLLSRWQKLDRVYSFLLAPCDDLTPEEYADLVVRLPSDGRTGALFPRFLQAAAKLRDPKIRSMVLSLQQQWDWVVHTKGMRLFGKRSIPDSEVFMELTHPLVRLRGFPTGLDLMAANGSARARELIAQSPMPETAAYREGLARGTALLSGLKGSETPTHYVQFLRVAETLYAPPPDKAPAFARTRAYTDKNLMTSLASWASMRHAWVLHAKQGLTFLGNGGRTPVPGYVEPNPEFFEAMRTLTKETVRAFRPIRTVEIERLERFLSLVESLSTMVDKELSGEAFSEKEVALLYHYPHRIARLQGFHFNAGVQGQFPWMSLIADIHGELASSECLEVGTGGAMPIYVIVAPEGAPQLLKGGVYSYYEFRQPFSDRLTDEQWRARWDRGPLPPMPKWTSSFVARLDAESVLTRLRAGERVSEALYLDDPRIGQFLWEGVQPGGALEGKKNFNWALEVVAAKRGREVIPLLYAIVREAPGGRRDYHRWYLLAVRSKRQKSKTFAAAYALATVLAKQDLPMLVEMALGNEKGSTDLAFSIGCAIRGKAMEDFMMQLFRRTDEARRKRYCINALGSRGSKDVSPFLLQAWRTGDSQTRIAAMSALGSIWSGGRSGPLPRLPTEATDTELSEWRRQIAEFTVQELKGEDRSTGSYAVRLAGRARIPEVVRVLAKLDAHERLPYASIPEALAAIGTKEAMDLLLRLAAVKSPSNKQAVLKALGDARHLRAVPRLRQLLLDKSRTNTNDYRVCDCAADALAAILPDGPGFRLGDERWKRDAKIEEWLAYLTADRVFEAMAPSR